MHAEEFDECERTLDRILLLDAHFAEACNQRAVLHYLTGRFASSLMACRRTLALNPHHFGAAAGVGHNHVQLGQLADAEAAYHRALRLHPRMEGVRQQLRRTRSEDPSPQPPVAWRRPG
jgi:cytochrome c-type biogenesis protein CcmH/NrfG